ncbi:MAG: hypothetical protein AB1552_05090 [Nitrospirota bacterium]
MKQWYEKPFENYADRYDKEEFTRCGNTITGIDLSESMLVTAKKPVLCRIVS